MYIPLYTKSSVEKCGVGTKNGGWARSTWEAACEMRATNLPIFAAYLLDDGPDVWKALLILRTRPIVPADHLVKLCMSASLDFRV